MAERLSEVLREHAWRAAFGGCGEPCNWQSSEGEDEQDEHAAHVAIALEPAVAALIAARLAPIEALATELDAAARNRHHEADGAMQAAIAGRLRDALGGLG